MQACHELTEAMLEGVRYELSFGCLHLNLLSVLSLPMLVNAHSTHAMPACLLKLVWLQREDKRLAKRIAQLLTARADMDISIETQKQLLPSPELLQHYPELTWERAASQQTVQRLGIAQKLFVKDRKMADFRHVSSASVMLLNSCDTCTDFILDVHLPLHTSCHCTQADSNITRTKKDRV